MKKRNAGNVIFRLGLLTVLSIGGFIGYQKIVRVRLSQKSSDKVGQVANMVLGQVEGLASALHIDTKSLVSTANKKLIESQPIITDQVNNAAGDVLGDSASNITDSAKQIIQNTAAKVTDQIKDLPRQEAVNITKSVCEQIISNLQKQ